MKITIYVGGVRFTADSRILQRSLLFGSLIKTTKCLSFDRDPMLFRHVLSWLKDKKIYVDCPSDQLYEALVQEALFYEIPCMFHFVRNRINLCSYLYVNASDGIFRIDLNAYRTLKYIPRWIEGILEGDVDLIAHNAISCDIDLRLAANIIKSPTVARTFYCTQPIPQPIQSALRAFFHKKNVIIEDMIIRYRPILCD